MRIPYTCARYRNTITQPNSLARYVGSYYCLLATIVTLERYPHYSIAMYLIWHYKVTIVSYSNVLKLTKACYGLFYLNG